MPPIPKPQVVKATKGASPDLTMLDKASSRHGDEFLLQQGPDGLEDFLSEATSLADEFSEVSEADVQQQQPSSDTRATTSSASAPHPLGNGRGIREERCKDSRDCEKEANQ